MIRRVRGELADCTEELVEIVTADGIGYGMRVPQGLPGRLRREDAPVELHTVLVVRDDTMELYGFATGRERELFQRLRTPSGVGPRLALAILGALPANRVVRAIRDKDYKTLQTVSGVGRKTAERIVIDLADKVDDLGAVGEEAGRAQAGPVADVVQALRALGYRSAESDDAVRRALESLAGEGAAGSADAAAGIGSQELLRQALRLI